MQMRRETGPQNGPQGRIEVTQPAISSQLHFHTQSSAAACQHTATHYLSWRMTVPPGSPGLSRPSSRLFSCCACATIELEHHPRTPPPLVWLSYPPPQPRKSGRWTGRLDYRASMTSVARRTNTLADTPKRPPVAVSVLLSAHTVWNTSRTSCVQYGHEYEYQYEHECTPARARPRRARP